MNDMGLGNISLNNILPRRDIGSEDDIIAVVDGCEVRESEWGYSLFRGGYIVASMLNKKVLHTTYGGSFQRWARTIKRKDIRKGRKYRAVAAKMEEECGELLRLWGEDGGSSQKSGR